MDGEDAGGRDEPHDVPREPAVALVTTRPGSEWTVNWAGAGVLLVLVVVGVVAWRALGGGGDDGAASGAPSVSVGDVVETVATTTPPTPSTTAAPGATTAVPTTAATSTTDPQRRVLISAEMKPCRFGDNCLAASFTIEGFDQPSGQFFCIYPNSRREFSFQDDGKEDACLTADEGDTITIEVDGVQSATVSEDNLEGTP